MLHQRTEEFKRVMAETQVTLEQGPEPTVYTVGLLAVNPDMLIYHVTLRDRKRLEATCGFGRTLHFEGGDTLRIYPPKEFRAVFPIMELHRYELYIVYLKTKLLMDYSNCPADETELLEAPRD